MSYQNQTLPRKKPVKRNRKCDEMVKIAEVDKMPELMLCSLCEGVPSPNYLSVCQDGHFMCSRCHRSTPRGICPRDLVSGKICNKRVFSFKCTLYEYFFNNSIFNCEYANLGCPTSRHGRDLAAHCQNCKYRPILPCAFTDCKIRVAPYAYSKHLQDVHQVFKVDSDTYRVQVPCNPMNTETADPIGRRWVCGLLNSYGCTFILLAEERGPDVHIWVALGSPEDIKGRQFKCRLRLFSEDIEMIWKGNVYPFQKVYDKSLPEVLLYQTKKVMAKNFVFKSGEGHYWFTDVKIKEVFPEGGIPPGLTSSVTNEINDLNHQGINSGATTAEFYRNIFRKVADCEEKSLADL